MWGCPAVDLLGMVLAGEWVEGFRVQGLGLGSQYRGTIRSLYGGCMDSPSPKPQNPKP